MLGFKLASLRNMCGFPLAWLGLVPPACTTLELFTKGVLQILHWQGEDVKVIAIMLCALFLQVGTSQAQAPATAKDGPWESRTSLRIGDSLPHFKLTPAPGTSVSPISDAALQGQRTVFVIVTAFCPHCRNESRMLASLKTRYEGKLRFVFASVSKPNETEDFIRDVGLRDCTYVGALPMAVEANVHHLPLLLLIGDEGKVVYIQHHEVERTLEQSILDAFAAGSSIPSEGVGKSDIPAPCSVFATTACDATPQPKAP